MPDNKDSKDIKIIFAPGCFDHFEGTQEELDDLVKEIQNAFTDGSLIEKSVPVDLYDGSWSEEEIEKLFESIEENINVSSGNRTLQ